MEKFIENQNSFMIQRVNRQIFKQLAYSSFFTSLMGLLYIDKNSTNFPTNNTLVIIPLDIINSHILGNSSL